MDARSFSVYLKRVLLENVEYYNQVLYAASCKDMYENQRMAGRREMLVSVADDLENILKTFEEGNK